MGQLPHTDHNTNMLCSCLPVSALYLDRLVSFVLWNEKTFPENIPWKFQVTPWARLCFLNNALCPKYLYVLWKKNKLKHLNTYIFLKNLIFVVLFCFLPSVMLKTQRFLFTLKKTLLGLAWWLGSFLFIYFLIKPPYWPFPQFLKL